MKNPSMRITINDCFATPAQIAVLRKAAADFILTYDGNSLVNAFNRAFAAHEFGKIIDCEITIYVNSGDESNENPVCSFMVDIVLKRNHSQRLTFCIDYINGQFNVCNDPSLHYIMPVPQIAE